MTSRWGFATAAALGAATIASAQSNVLFPNDDCVNATPIAGVGAFQYDNSPPLVTTSPEPLVQCNAAAGGAIVNDVWFCWTAPCTGLVEISTCYPFNLPAGYSGTANFDPVVALYDGCACPGQTPPRCCSDDDNAVHQPCNDLQAFLQCDVICGEQYLIRVGSKPGVVGGAGIFSIRFANPPGCNSDACPRIPACANACCGEAPNYTDPTYTANFTGRIAVQTDFDSFAAVGSDFVVTIYDLDGAAPTLGANWDPVTSCAVEPFRYPPTGIPACNPASQWTRPVLGSVFGLTLDDAGNIYVTHSTSYSFSGIGSIPTSTSTTIYKLANGTFDGTPTVFANLPNCGSCAANTEPGLGNIHFSCAHESFYVSHFDDGQIYRLDRNGTVLEAYDHATDAINPGSGPEPGHVYGSFAPLGERVWAVQVWQDRLYYSVWGQSMDSTLSTGTSTIPNRVWSVALVPAGVNKGSFVGNSRRQELQLPTLSPDTNQPNPLGFSNPVADISFGPNCQMLVAERSMTGDRSIYAHSSRGIEYQWTGNAWVPSPTYNNSNGYPIGNYSQSGNHHRNASGGCDYDYATASGNGTHGRSWFTGDALIFSPGNFVYGATGVDPANTALTNSIFIDNSRDTSVGEKTEQGDIEVACPKQCAEIIDGRILCEVGDEGGLTGCYTYTFSLTNNSANDVQYILIPSANVTPNVIGPFAPSPLSPGEKYVATVKICNVTGTTFTLPVILMDTDNNICCDITHDVELPDCECFQLLEDAEMVCGPNGPVLSIPSLQPLDFNVGHIFVAYEPGNVAYQVNLSQTYFPVSIPQFGTYSLNIPFTTTAPAGTVLCFRVTIHTPDLVTCCSEVVCITVVDCVTPTCPGDLNNDGVINLTDLSLLLSNFGGSGVGLTGDINRDGRVDLNDLAVLLAGFGGQCE